MDAEEVPASICNKLEDVYKDEQVLDQGSIVEIEHPELGKMRMPRPPVNFKGQAEFPRSLAPILGADTREVLTDLGIEDDIISQMEQREEQNRVMLESFTPISS
jgi:crotonobetainyl-CoA:carnitine CoA-transferase CaiB-like acyl-CoA transferase